MYPVQRRRASAALAYSLAVLLPTASLLLRLALSSKFGDDPALELFLIPIILSAYTGGAGPGLLSTAVVALLTDYFLLPPKYSFSIQSGGQSLEWLVLILAGTLISVLLRRSSAGSSGAGDGFLDNKAPRISPDSATGLARTIVICAGSLCAALGAATLIGWFFHIPTLTFVRPGFNPMAANVAVGMLLDGLGLLFVASGRSRAALAGAIWSYLIGLATLAEFGFSINLHIDELLVRDYILATPAYPGRPAPNAAVCLVLCGVALSWAAIPRWRNRATNIIGVLGGVVFALGAVAVCGYLIGLPLYALGDSKPMAANAGLGFLALGLGVMACVWHRSQLAPEKRDRSLLRAEWKIRIGFGCGLACLMVVGGMSYLVLVRLHEDSVLVRHTQQVIASLRRVLSTIAEAEGEVRGYVITGNEEFLETYQNAAGDADTEMRILRSLTADNAAERGRLETLVQLVSARLSSLQDTVDARSKEGFRAAQQHTASGRGKQIQDRILGVLAEMEAAEQSLLQQRVTRSRRNGRVAQTVIIAGVTLAFAIVVVALFVISQDLAGCRRAQAALEEARNQLETRVQERTAELAEANEATRDSEARLAGIIHSAMDAIITVDDQQKIVLFNPAAEKMFGCRAAEVIGGSLDVCIPERFRGAHAQNHRTFGETGLTQRQMGNLGAVFGLRARGEEFPIEASISRLNLGGRKLLTAILRDVTERVRAEESLRRQAELFDQAYDATFVWEWGGAITFWNRGAERLYGYSRDEAVGKVSQRLLRTKTVGSFVPFVVPLKEDGKWEGELEHTTRDGRQMTVDGRMALVRDGEHVYVLETTRDVTERKRAEEALRAERHLLETVVNHLPAAVLLAEETDLRIRLVNPAYLAFAPGKAMAGRALGEIWPEIGPEVPNLFRHVLATGEPHHAIDEPFMIRRSAGGPLEKAYFSWSVFRIPLPGHERYGLLNTAWETTQRKRTEEEIQLLNRDLERRVEQRTAELQAANKELESFSYSVAHDLRAPLRAVDGFSDALLEDYGSQLPEQARKHLETIRRGAQRMGHLIDDLLAFSRLNRQAMTKQTVDMEFLVRSVLEDFVPQGRGRNIHIVNGNLPAAHGDPSLLRQVWANLLSNAIKYSRQVEQARIEIGALVQAQHNVYFVRDNGAGFDMKYADKLFGVFQRLHHADEFEGTGIGLAIVQRVIHRHGGRVWAEAKLNEGATFYFTLDGGP